jgi:hypothetical protein
MAPGVHLPRHAITSLEVESHFGAAGYCLARVHWRPCYAQLQHRQLPELLRPQAPHLLSSSLSLMM